MLVTFMLTPITPSTNGCLSVLSLRNVIISSTRRVRYQRPLHLNNLVSRFLLEDSFDGVLLAYHLVLTLSPSEDIINVITYCIVVCILALVIPHKVSL